MLTHALWLLSIDNTNFFSDYTYETYILKYYVWYERLNNKQRAFLTLKIID